MKVLFLTQVLPYPLTGGQRIRAYYLLRHLHKNHDVTLVSFVRPDDHENHVQYLEEFCHAVYTVPIARSWSRNVKAGIESYLKGIPIVIARDSISEMQSVIKQLVKEDRFDIVHADQTSMAMYGLYAYDVHEKTRRPKTILDQHNALHLVVRRQARYMRGFNRLVWKREASLLAEYEADLCKDYDHVLTVTQNDKEALKALFGNEMLPEIDQRISVIPICMDPTEEHILDRRSIDPSILFVGSLVWPPNVDAVIWFSERVLPRLKERISDVKFTVIGKDPPASIGALVSDDSTISDPINITGFVEDLDPYITNHRVFIVPLRAGGGMRVKIVYAWLKGIPVVSTSIGAEGLEYRDGENILIADEPEQLAEAVEQVLTDNQLADRLRVNGRRTVESYYDYQTAYRAVDLIYDGLFEK